MTPVPARAVTWQNGEDACSCLNYKLNVKIGAFITGGAKPVPVRASD